MTKIGEIKENIIKHIPIPVSINENFNNYDFIDQYFNGIQWDKKYNLFFSVKSCEEMDSLKGLIYRIENLFKGQKIESLTNSLIMPLIIDFYGFESKSALQLDRKNGEMNF